MFVLLMVPVLYAVLHMLFMRLPAPEGREIFRANAWGEKYRRSRISADLFVQTGASIF
jgi:hypothetical protein